MATRDATGSEVVTTYYNLNTFIRIQTMTLNTVTSIMTEEWTNLFKEGLDRHRQLGHDEGYRIGYKEGYLAAVHELQMAAQTINSDKYKPAGQDGG